MLISRYSSIYPLSSQGKYKKHSIPKMKKRKYYTSHNQQMGSGLVEGIFRPMFPFNLETKINLSWENGLIFEGQGNSNKFIFSVKGEKHPNITKVHLSLPIGMLLDRKEQVLVYCDSMPFDFIEEYQNILQSDDTSDEDKEKAIFFLFAAEVLRLYDLESISKIILSHENNRVHLRFSVLGYEFFGKLYKIIIPDENEHDDND